MSLEYELYDEKRRKMRRSSFLKGSFLTLLLIGLPFIIWKQDLLSYPHIAKFNVYGEIYDSPERDSTLKEIAENEDDLVWFEMFVVRMMLRDNIFRRCDVLLESGDIRFNVEEDAWFSC